MQQSLSEVYSRSNRFPLTVYYTQYWLHSFIGQFDFSAPLRFLHQGILDKIRVARTYLYESVKQFYPFLWFLASLIKIVELYENFCIFFCKLKNVWDIGIHSKPHFYKKCKYLRNPTTDFSFSSTNKPQDRDHKAHCTRC